MRLDNLTTDSRKIVASMGQYKLLEYIKDESVSPGNAMYEYYMEKMNVHRRQVIVQMNGNMPVILQAGAMQWMAGNIDVRTNVQGVGDLIGKAFSAKVTKESAIKPMYQGQGLLALEPTYKYIIFEDVSQWPGGMVLEDGMFLAADASLQQRTVARQNLSSAALGGEGLFNLCLNGNGIAVLESNVPREELIVAHLNNETLKLDGPLAVCWSGSLQFTVERTTKTLIGSAASGEGLVNVYRGTGTVWYAPVTNTSSLYSATH